jgi:hypothetical protein
MPVEGSAPEDDSAIDEAVVASVAAKRSMAARVRSGLTYSRMQFPTRAAERLCRTEV